MLFQLFFCSWKCFIFVLLFYSHVLNKAFIHSQIFCRLYFGKLNTSDQDSKLGENCSSVKGPVFVQEEQKKCDWIFDFILTLKKRCFLTSSASLSPAPSRRSGLLLKSCSYGDTQASLPAQWTGTGRNNDGLFYHFNFFFFLHTLLMIEMASVERNLG